MLNFFKKKGFRNAKKPTRREIEEREKIKAFFDGYKELCTTHGMQLLPIIKKLEHGGFEPDFKLGEYTPKPEPELKGWGQAEKENLEVRKACTHTNNDTQCTKCGLRLADQHESGTGVEANYERVKLEKIKNWEEKALADEIKVGGQ